MPVWRDPSEALDLAFSEIVEKLERTREPWRRQHSPFSLNNGVSVRLNALGGFEAGSGLTDKRAYLNGIPTVDVLSNANPVQIRADARSRRQQVQ